MTEKDRSCSVDVQHKKKHAPQDEEHVQKLRTMSDGKESTIQLIWLGQGIYFQSISQLPPGSQKKSCKSDHK